jgi:hypothetical protein
MHRTQDAYSVITVIGYSFPPYDCYAYEALGPLIIGYQHRGERTYFGHRRVPVQIINKGSAAADLTGSTGETLETERAIFLRRFSGVLNGPLQDLRTQRPGARPL